MKRLLSAGLIASSLIYSASADPGQGIHAGSWTISPYVDESGTYDSNVYNTRSNVKNDVFADSTIGLRAGYSSYMLEMSGLGFLSQRNYADATDLNFTSVGELLRAKYSNRDQVEVEASQTFRRLNGIDRYGSEFAVGSVSPDTVLDISGNTPRDINQVELSAGKDVTDKLELDAAYRFDDINYDQVSLYDLRDHVGQIEAAHQLTDKTAGFLTINGAIQENLSLDNQAESYATRLGLKTKGTDKITFKGGAGLQYYDQVNGDGRTTLSFDLTSYWAVTDKIGLSLGGRNGSQMSSLYVDNSVDYQDYWFGGSYKVTPAFKTTLSVGYRVDDYIDPITYNNHLINRRDKGLGGSLRADYQAPAKFLKLYAEVLQNSVNSNVSGYDDTRLTLGAILSY